MTTIADIKVHKVSGPWRILEALAIEIVNDASRNAKSDFNPVLGGGTRFMLSMERQCQRLVQQLVLLRTGVRRKRIAFACP